MERELSPEEEVFYALIEALRDGGWNVSLATSPPVRDAPDYVAISHDMLPKNLMPILLEMMPISEFEIDSEMEQKLFEQQGSKAPQNVLGLSVDIGELDGIDLLEGELLWTLYHRDHPARGPIGFSATVNELAGRIPYVLQTFDKWAEEEAQREGKKKKEPKANTAKAKLEGVSEKSKKQGTSNGESKRPGSHPDMPPLPFQFVPGADPGEADIIIVPVSVDGLLSDDARSTLKWIGFEGPWPVDVDLSPGYGLVEGTTKDERVLFVVTRHPNRRVAHLLDANLPKALAHLSQEVNLADRIVHVPLMQAETGAKGLEAGLDVILRSFSSALTNPSNQPARIIIAPPGGLSPEQLEQLQRRLPQDIQVELESMRIDGLGSEGVSDAPSTDPKLEFKKIAGSFRHFIDEMVLKQNTEEDQQGSLMTIGLFGRWGTGKSTMINALRDAFSDDFVQILLNAWKWDGKEDIHDFFRRHVLEQVRRKKPWLYTKFLARRFVARLIQFIGLFGMVAAFGMLAFFVYWLGNEYNLLPSLKNEVPDLFFKSTVTTGMAGGALWAFYNIIFKGMRTAIAGVIENFLTPKHAQQLGREGLAATYKDIATVYQDSRPVFVLKKNRRPPTPFIFYIDDLDRCPPERVVAFIESIHSLTMAGCVIFIACDENFVSAALQAHYKKVADEHPAGSDFGRRFLGKIVQMPFRIPAVDAEGMRELGLISDPQETVQPSGGGLAGSTMPKPPRIAPGPVEFPGPSPRDGKAPETGQKTPEDVPEPPVLLKLIPAIHREPIKVRLNELLGKLDTETDLSEDQVLAFVVADRFFPEALDKILDGQAAQIPTGLWNQKVSSLIERDLGSLVKKELEILNAFRIVRVSHVLNRVISPLTRPLSLTVREVKRVKNQLRIYLRIKAVSDQAQVECFAAFLLADWLDPDWLDVYMELKKKSQISSEGRISQLSTDDLKILEGFLGGADWDDLNLRRWRASA